MIDPVVLTQKLVRCESVTPEDDGALEVLAAPLRDLGFQVTDLPFCEDGTSLIHNFFARIGTGGRHLCFLGHTDVVPVGRESDWTYPPFAAEIHDGMLYGRGSADMKAADAAFVAAVSRFLSEYPDFQESISIVMTGDEEGVSVNGTVKVVEWMQQNGHMPTVALVGEPSNPSHLGQVMRVGRRGSWNARLRVLGVQGHSAYPERADNPVPKLVELLHVLGQEKLDNGSDFFPPSHCVVAGIDAFNAAPNVIPARAEALINIRFNDLWTAESLESHIRAVLDAVGVAYELETWCNAHSFLVTDTEWRDVVAAAVENVSGMAPEFNTGGGTSDARHIAPFVPVVEYGGVNETIHKVNEYVKLSEIEELTDTYFIILKTYFSVQDD